VVLQLQDAAGNPVAPGSALPLVLESSTPATLLGLDCSTPLAAPALAGGSTLFAFRFRPEQAGAFELQARLEDGSLTTARTYTVVPGPATRLGFPGASLGFVAGTCGGPVRLEVRDAFDNRATLTEAHQLTVSVLEAGAQAFLDAACQTAAGTLDLPAGASEASLYLRATVAGPVTLTAAGLAFPQVSQEHTCLPGPPEAIVFLSGSQRLQAAGCSGAVVVEARDAFGNPSPVTSGMDASLEASPSEGVRFFAGPGCTEEATALAWPAGEPRGTFHFIGTLAGTVLLEVVAGSWAPISQTEVIEPGPTVALVFESFPQLAAFGEAFPVTLRAVDAWGNRTPAFVAKASLTLSSPVPLTCVTGCTSGTTTKTFSSGLWTGSLAVSEPGGRGLTLTATSGTITSRSPTFDVLPPASAPLASFVASVAVARVGDSVTFDASASRDAQTLPVLLQVSWDFGGGTGPAPWTAWSPEKTVSHVFTSAGTRAVRLAVLDESGLLGYARHTLWVVEAGNPDLCVVNTSQVDVTDGALGCLGPFGTDGKLSLAEAVAIANASPDRQTLTFAGPLVLTGEVTYTFSDAVSLLAPPGVVLDGVSLVFGGGQSQLSGVELTGSSSQVRVEAGAVLEMIDVTLHQTGGLRVAGTASLERTQLDYCATCIALSSDSARLSLGHSRVAHATFGVRLTRSQSSPAVEARSTVFSYLDTALSAGSASTGSVILRNNTFFQNQIGLVLEKGAGHVLRNNVFAHHSDTVLTANAATFATRDHHLLWGNKKAGGLDGDPFTTQEDPLFAQEALDDLRLQPDSPGRDAALDEGLDLNGAAPGLFEGAGPDLGAFESL